MSIDDGVSVLTDALGRRCFQPKIRVETGQIGEADGGEACGCGWAPELSLSRVTTSTPLTNAMAITSPTRRGVPSAAVTPSASDATHATAPATGWEMPQSPSTLSALPTPPTRVSLAQLAPVIANLYPSILSARSPHSEFHQALKGPSRKTVIALCIAEF